MTINEIAEKILADAREQGRLVEVNAAWEAERRIAESGKIAELKGEEVSVRRAEAIEDERERALIAAKLARRDRSIVAKRELLQSTFTKAGERLAGLEEHKYVELVSSLIARHATGGQEIVLDSQTPVAVRRGIIDRANKLLDQAGLDPVRLSEQTRDLGAGFILAGGHIEEDRSFENLLKTAAQELEARVARVLFGDV